MKFLSVVIPTFNEKESIERTIEKVRGVLDDQVKDKGKEEFKYEIVVCDDDSPDKTADVARNMADKVIVRKSNKGLSQAVIEGFNFAKGEYMLVMDADGQHDEKAITKMIKYADKYELIIGSRYNKKGSTKDWSFIRLAMSRFASYLAYPLISRKKITDPMSGFFMIKKDLFLSIKDKINTKGFKILLDILFCIDEKVKIKEVGYSFNKRERGVSKLGFGVKIDYLKMIFFEYLKQYNTFIKFSIVGTLGVFINLLVLFMLVELVNFKPIIASIVAIEMSIVNNFLLNNKWTFNYDNFKFSRFLKFNMVSIGTLAVNLIVFALLLEFGVYYVLAQFVGIVFAFLLNFFVNVKWVFKK
jgi:dolichol-phosphate mannosyltransferase